MENSVQPEILLLSYLQLPAANSFSFHRGSKKTETHTHIQKERERKRDCRQEQNKVSKISNFRDMLKKWSFHKEV